MIFGIHVGGIHIERTMSQILCLCLSFYFMKSRNFGIKK